MHATAALLCTLAPPRLATTTDAISICSWNDLRLGW